MTTVLIQYDDRTVPLFEQLMARNQSYCMRHTYTYWRPTQEWVEHNKDTMSPYWMKVALVHHMMQQQGVAYVAWFDSDACVHAQERRIETLFQPDGPDFLISEDAWSANVLNVGVFLLRVTDRSRALMDEWLACYPAHQWTHSVQPNQWMCTQQPQNEPCVWAGSAYEQGAFNERIVIQFPGAIQRFPVHVLDCSAPHPPFDTFSCHLISPGTNKYDNIQAYLNAQDSWFTCGAGAGTSIGVTVGITVGILTLTLAVLYLNRT